MPKNLIRSERRKKVLADAGRDSGSMALFDMVDPSDPDVIAAMVKVFHHKRNQRKPAYMARVEDARRKRHAGEYAVLCDKYHVMKGREEGLYQEGKKCIDGACRLFMKNFK